MVSSMPWLRPGRRLLLQVSIQAVNRHDLLLARFDLTLFLGIALPTPDSAENTGFAPLGGGWRMWLRAQVHARHCTSVQRVGRRGAARRVSKLAAVLKDRLVLIPRLRKAHGDVDVVL